MIFLRVTTAYLKLNLFDFDFEQNKLLKLMRAPNQNISGKLLKVKTFLSSTKTNRNKK